MQTVRFGAVVPMLLSREQAQKIVAPDNRVVYKKANKLAYVVTGPEDMHAIDQLTRIRRQFALEKDEKGVAEANRSINYFLLNQSYKDRFVHTETPTTPHEILNEAGNSMGVTN